MYIYASTRVVEAFDVIADSLGSSLPGRPCTSIEELLLHGSEEALHARIIPTVSLATHAANRVMPLEKVSVGLARILTLAVRVVDEPVT